MSVLIIVVFTLVLCTFGTTEYTEHVDDTVILRVANGEQVKTIEDAPFIALYLFQGASFRGTCGASILTPKFLLSAAHCYCNKELCQYNILVGSNKRGAGRKYQVHKNIFHPDYDKSTNEYDVQVIKIFGKLRFDATVQPIKMADSSLIIREGSYLKVFGFGLTEHNHTSDLREAIVSYVSLNKCRSIYRNMNVITDNMICAGENGEGSCQGDSGGPLVYDNVLVGVISFGVDVCGDPTFPGVYTSVSRVRTFIDYAIRTQ